MSKEKLFAIGIAILASVAASVLFLINTSATYSSPEKSIAAFVDAESRADLSAMEKPAGFALYQNFVGHFGQAKYQQVRSIYLEAYSLAEPQWEQYREKARVASEREHQRLADEISKLGRSAFDALPADQRLQMTDDRSRFDQFIFDEGLKALPPNDRSEILDPLAFRENRDVNAFTDREGFSLLSEEDQKELKAPATISAALTPARIAYLESIGLPQLTSQQRKNIDGVAFSDLSNPQEFMLRYGRGPAQEFLKNSGLDPIVSMGKCKYASEDEAGSLFKGSTATCTFSVLVRGARVDASALLLKQAGIWRIVALEPMLTDIREAYPPKPVRRESAETPAIASPAPEPVPTDVAVQRPWLPLASWNNVTDPAVFAIGRDAMLVGISRVFPGPISWLLKALFIFLAIVIFCVIMTINYRRLRNETFLPEWLEGEVQLEQIEVTHWWSRVWLRLTNKRIIQVRLSWLFSRRRIFGIALDDIHSATWSRYINWLLILIGIVLFYYNLSNPVALLILMWGLESRILSIRFNTPLARMPFPRARASITSFRRGQFNELATFYKKAQLYLAQVRTQKQLPVPRNVSFIPEEDKDFSWGRPVWVFVAMWLVIAVAQRTLGDHVNLDGLWGGLLLGLPVAAAAQSLRSGVWSGLLGASAFVAVKFPGSLGLLLLARGSDGGSPSLWQYLVLVLGATAVAAAAYGFSQLHPTAGFFAPLLWVVLFAIMAPASLREMATYVTCVIGVASAAAFSFVAEALAARTVSPTPVPESVIA